MTEGSRERKRFNRQQLAFREAKRALAERPLATKHGEEEKERSIHTLNCFHPGCGRILFVRMHRVLYGEESQTGTLEDRLKRALPEENIRNPLYCEHHQPEEEHSSEGSRFEESERP